MYKLIYTNIINTVNYELPTWSNVTYSIYWDEKQYKKVIVHLTHTFPQTYRNSVSGFIETLLTFIFPTVNGNSFYLTLERFHLWRFQIYFICLTHLIYLRRERRIDRIEIDESKKTFGNIRYYKFLYFKNRLQN